MPTHTVKHIHSCFIRIPQFFKTLDICHSCSDRYLVERKKSINGSSCQATCMICVLSSVTVHKWASGQSLVLWVNSCVLYLCNELRLCVDCAVADAVPMWSGEDVHRMCRQHCMGKIRMICEVF